MIIARSVTKARAIIEKAKRKGKLIGFIPTMGALHKGHLSLIRAAHKECDFIVASIFVNPTQFGPKEDLRRYPRNFNKDKRLLEKEKVDLIFFPHFSAMYGKNFSTYVEEVSLSKVLCGKSRPGHFRGVCTVVTKLFNIVQPDIAYFGQKDYQQVQIIKRMVSDLNLPVKIKILPIVREKNGLAMSSRNIYLTQNEREDALCLYAALSMAKHLIKKGESNSKNIVDKMSKIIKSKKTTRIDYVKIVDALTLQDVKKINTKVLVCLAVYIERVRLIDNILIKVS